MARIGGTCYFKIDGQQLSLTGGIEVPMNTKVNDDLIGWMVRWIVKKRTVHPMSKARSRYRKIFRSTKSPVPMK